MNLAYFRQSKFDFKKTVANLKDEIKKNNLDLMGEFELNNDQGMVINICQKNWISNLVASEKNFIGLLPCSVVVLKKDDNVMVGVGNPSLMGKLTNDPSIQDLAVKVEKVLRQIVEQSCGVGPLTVKKIKLYATMSCPYCKMEASWLDSHKVKYDHVLVDLNPSAGEEMVRKTGQMGVPVTEIIYDNDEVEYVIGFDKAKLEQILLPKN